MDKQEHNSGTGLNQNAMIQYLLGELPATWEETLEEQFFTDRESFAQLMMAEDRLIDAYLQGELSADQRARFESHFLVSDRRRQKIAFAQSLHRASEVYTAPVAAARLWSTSLLPRHFPNPTRQMALAAGVLLMLLGGIWLVLEARHGLTQSSSLSLPSVSKQEQAAPQSVERSQPVAEPEHLAGTIGRNEGGSQNNTEHSALVQPRLTQRMGRLRRILTLTIAPGREREVKEPLDRNEREWPVYIPACIRLLRLRLLLQSAADSGHYRVQLVTAEGEMILLPHPMPIRLTRDDRYAIILIPSRLLKSGDYVLTLLGDNGRDEYEELSDYYFSLRSR